MLVRMVSTNDESLARRRTELEGKWVGTSTAAKLGAAGSLADGPC
jgi:hypothetical protein